MFLERPAFVLERRINHPPPLVNAAVSTGSPLVAGADIPLSSAGSLAIDTPLRRTLGSYDLSYRADARLMTPRKRLVAHIEIEVDPWSRSATRLQLRPAARHPERWSARRLRRYFVLAHQAADHTARELGSAARTPKLHPVPHLVASSAG